MPADSGVLKCTSTQSKFSEKSFYTMPAVDKRYGRIKDKYNEKGDERGWPAWQEKVCQRLKKTIFMCTAIPL